MSKITVGKRGPKLFFSFLVRFAIGLVTVNLHNGHSLLRFRRLILLIVGAIIRGIAIAHKAVCDAHNVKEPKQVQRLQRRQQRRGDVLADPALVLLRLPVELKGPNGSKLGEEGDDDLDVDVVAQVDPDADKGEKVRRNQKVVEVVEHLGGGEKEVANVVRGVDGDANIGEVEAVAEPDEGKADHMVADELIVVLAGLFEAEDEDNRLLGPVGALEEVVKLDDSFVAAVGKVGVHAGRVVVPDGGLAHDVETGRAEKGKVDGCVSLLHEARLLALAKTSTARPRP